MIMSGPRSPIWRSAYDRDYKRSQGPSCNAAPISRRNALSRLLGRPGGKRVLYIRVFADVPGWLCDQPELTYIGSTRLVLDQTYRDHAARDASAGDAGFTILEVAGEAAQVAGLAVDAHPHVVPAVCGCYGIDRVTIRAGPQ
jgi:hypothetical protein